jgi:hypothetical protein
MNEHVSSFADYLEAHGIRKRGPVSVTMLNSPEICCTMFSIQKLGSIACSINYMLKGSEIVHEGTTLRSPSVESGYGYVGEKIGTCIKLHSSCFLPAEEITEYSAEIIAKYKISKDVDYMYDLSHKPTG